MHKILSHISIPTTVDLLYFWLPSICLSVLFEINCLYSRWQLPKSHFRLAFGLRDLSVKFSFTTDEAEQPVSNRKSCDWKLKHQSWIMSPLICWSSKKKHTYIHT